MQPSLETFINTEYENSFQNPNDIYPAVMSYTELLQQAQWKYLRSQILKRDEHCCKICSNMGTYNKWDSSAKSWKYYDVFFPANCRKYKNQFLNNGILDNFYIFDDRDIILTEIANPRNLHIHHQYYIDGRLPWQYQFTCFETLCVNCHFTLHQQQKIPYFIWEQGKLIKWEGMLACNRCNGAGHFPEYSHVQGGVCFKCSGNRFF